MEEEEGKRTANATVGTVSAATGLGGLVDLDVDDLEQVDVELLVLHTNKSDKNQYKMW